MNCNESFRELHFYSYIGKKIVWKCIQYGTKYCMSTFVISRYKTLLYCQAIEHLNFKSQCSQCCRWWSRITVLFWHQRMYVKRDTISKVISKQNIKYLLLCHCPFWIIITNWARNWNRIKVMRHHNTDCKHNFLIFKQHVKRKTFT
jgi:hypothetical protein